MTYRKNVTYKGIEAVWFEVESKTRRGEAPQ